jgi:hypothetical protein
LYNNTDSGDDNDNVDNDNVNDDDNDNNSAHLLVCLPTAVAYTKQALIIHNRCNL